MIPIHLPRSIATVALPHYSGAVPISKSMWMMSAALLPLLIWGMLIFGMRSLWIIGLSILTAVLCEAIAILLSSGSGNVVGKRLGDGSAVLGGFLLGLSLPVSVSLWVPVIASAFGIVLVKWSFGGLGANWLNPALAGRMFVQLSWPMGFAQNDWGNGLIQGVGWNVDAVSAASDLVTIKQALLETGASRIFRPLQMVGRSFSLLDQHITKFLNDIFLRSYGSLLPDGYVDYFLGFRTGAIGEISIVLILVISVFLLAREIIAWQIPASAIAIMACMSFAFSGSYWGADLFFGDALFALFSGGFLFTAFFMATDPVGSPYTSLGKLVFGAGFGILCFIFREYSFYADGSALALLFMNMLSSTIIRATQKRPFGYRRDGGLHV